MKVTSLVLVGGVFLCFTVGSSAQAADAAAAFVADVMPVLDRAGCNAAACHGAGEGKGGLRLSLFGAYPSQDYVAITRTSTGRLMNRIEPLKSLFLLKAAGAVAHGGKAPVKSGSAEHKALQAWLAAGAPFGDSGARVLTSVKLGPLKAKLAGGGQQQFKVTAVFSDGAQSDVTAYARYTSSVPAVVTAAAGGKVTARGFGGAAIIATYRRRSAVAQVTVPRELAKPFPKTPTNNKIDELVLAKLKELGILPSAPCTDAEFLRRVYLDVIGLPPTPDEARKFLADKDLRKRAKLIDALLQRDEYADFQTLKWGDLLRIKSEFPSNLWPNGVQAYYRWVRNSIATNKPYDKFATELLTSSGSNFRHPASNYYRALRKRDAQGYAEATALVFMGARISCARCHGHPTEAWTLADSQGMAAFFPQVRIKRTQEWKEEIVYLSPTSRLYDSTSRQVIAPKFLGGETVKLVPGSDSRAAFAKWLTAPDNPWFAKSIANRMWFWLFDRGIIHEVDDLRPTNPPTNPALLAYLESELVKSKYDLKHMYRLMLNSRTYQLSSMPNASNVTDAVYCSHYPVKRLGAEQFLDTINAVTETCESYLSRVPEPYTRLPKGTRAVQVMDGSIDSPFLKLFGRPPRDTAYESDRCRETSMRQALYMINSSELENRVSRSPRIARMLKAKAADAAVAEEVFLAALARFPSAKEKSESVKYLVDNKRNRTQAVRDLMWAVLNTKEFMFNH